MFRLAARLIRSFGVILEELETIRAGQLNQNRVISQVRGLVLTNQDKLDQLSADLGTATDGIRSDITELKAQIANGVPAEELDFTALDERVTALSALDAETPAPVDPLNG